MRATINGVAANVLSVGTTVITIEVPQGATTGPLVVTLPGGEPVTLGTFYVQGISVTPKVARIVQGQAEQFTANVTGLVDTSVTWSLVRPVGLEPAVNLGTLSPGGLYTPPAVPEVFEIIIKATSVEQPFLSALARAQVFGTLASAPPAVAVVLPGPGQAGGLQASTTVASPPEVSVLVSGPGEASGLAANVTVAAPPDVSVLVPGAGDPGALPLSTFVALPPEISVLLPGVGEAGGLDFSPFLALPPDISVLLPGAGSDSGLSFNTFLALPSVLVQFAAEQLRAEPVRATAPPSKEAGASRNRQ